MIDSSGLAATPVNSDLNGVQAGDLVTFAMVIENTGTGLNGAFDVQFRDTLPAGFVIPAGGLNMSLTDGTGAAFATPTDLGGGLFGSGLQLVDPGPTTVALAPYDPTSGRNIAILTYDLQVAPTVTPSQTIVNTATLAGDLAVPGGPDFLLTDLTDPASVTVLNVAVAKSITATDQSFTTGSDLAIGEVATYTVGDDHPPGRHPGRRWSTPSRTAWQSSDLDSLTPSDTAVITASAGSFDSILQNAVVSPNGGARPSSSATSPTPTPTPLARRPSPPFTAWWP